MTRPEDPDDRMETHPDLVDPNWRKHAELDAWLGAKKEMKKRRKRERRSGVTAGYGYTSAPSRWPRETLVDSGTVGMGFMLPASARRGARGS